MTFEMLKLTTSIQMMYAQVFEECYFVFLKVSNAFFQAAIVKPLSTSCIFFSSLPQFPEAMMTVVVFHVFAT